MGFGVKFARAHVTKSERREVCGRSLMLLLELSLVCAKPKPRAQTVCDRARMHEILLYTKAIHMETSKKLFGSEMTSMKEVTPQFLGVVRLQSALMGLA